MPIIEREDAKQHLNITDNADDSLIDQKIGVAEAWVETFIGRALADFGAPKAVPTPILEAIRQIVGHLYENREASLIDVNAEMLPLGVYELLNPYREFVF